MEPVYLRASNKSWKLACSYAESISHRGKAQHTEQNLYTHLKAHPTPPNRSDPQCTVGLAGARSSRPRRCRAAFDGIGQAGRLRSGQARWAALCSKEPTLLRLCIMLVRAHHVAMEAAVHRKQSSGAWPAELRRAQSRAPPHL